MKHPLFALAAVGAAGFVLWKAATLLLLPVLFTILKFVLLGALIWLAFWFFTRKKDKGGEATTDS